jgi:hypothetical protein
LNGFAAISTYNGWVMAGTGAIIVFCGLAALSFAISLLPKLLSLIEKRTVPSAAEEIPAAGPATPEYCPADIREAARLYEPLILELGEPFRLVDLYKLTRERDFPHPHLTISCLRQANFLVADGDGAFTWNPEGPNT